MDDMSRRTMYEKMREAKKLHLAALLSGRRMVVLDAGNEDRLDPLATETDPPQEP